MIHLASARGAIPIEPETVDALALKWHITPMQMGDQLLRMHLWLLRNPARRPANVFLFIDKWMKKQAPATTHRDERRENINELTGRQPHGGRHSTGYPPGVDAKVVQEVPGNVWEPDGANVRRLSRG
jgi:hypothetical protein